MSKIFNNINELFHTYEIGNIIHEPISISGGLMHKMYKVMTATNVYAVKWLNPSIMRRKGVVDHMINSERIANALSSHLPAIAAIHYNESPLLSINDNYYMVFHWIEGTSIFPPSISNRNCYEIGNALGIIHQLNISLADIKKENYDTVNFNWKQYADMGFEQGAAWLDIYNQIMDKLIVWTKRMNEATSRLSESMVISHRDLDPKNVMWNDDQPYIIDWEAAGYVNPYQELLEVLNYWADDGKGQLNKENFDTLLQAYGKHMCTRNVDWKYVLDSGYGGMLGWLEYSIKRALGLEVSDDLEKKLGEEQITATIEALEKYNNQVETIKKWVNNT